jgi:hypothetical protein
MENKFGRVKKACTFALPIEKSTVGKFLETVKNK